MVNDWNKSKNVLFHGLVIWYALLHIFFSSLCSATSVDVEEGLYKKAQALGISVVTISQVCCVLRWVSRSFFVPSLNTCIMCHLHKGFLNISSCQSLSVILLLHLSAFPLDCAATCFDSLSCHGVTIDWWRRWLGAPFDTKFEFTLVLFFLCLHLCNYHPVELIVSHPVVRFFLVCLLVISHSEVEVLQVQQAPELHLEVSYRQSIHQLRHCMPEAVICQS